MWRGSCPGPRNGDLKNDFPRQNGADTLRDRRRDEILLETGSNISSMKPRTTYHTQDHRFSPAQNHGKCAFFAPPLAPHPGGRWPSSTRPASNLNTSAGCWKRGAMCPFRLLALECAVAHVRGKIGFVEETICRERQRQGLASSAGVMHTSGTPPEHAPGPVPGVASRP